LRLDGCRDAVRLYRAALAWPGFPGDDMPAVVHASLARCLGALGDEIQAMKEGEEAVRLAPQWPVVLNDLAAQYARRGRYGEALRLYLRTIEVDPRDAEARRGVLALRPLAGVKIEK